MLINDIFPCEDEREYVMKTISLGLFGSNCLEEYYIWIGSGANGKGLMATLLNATLGKYAGTMDINYFMKTNHGEHAGRATPELARNKNSRIVIINEIGTKH